MTYEQFTNRFHYDPNQDLLGAGGFGRVFKAKDTWRSDVVVALKIADVRPEQEAFSLRAEFELAERLRNDHVAVYMGCQRLSFPHVGNQDVAWMTYYEAGDLAKLLARRRLSVAQKDYLLRGLLDGIEYLHRRSVVHRDIKPANILIETQLGQDGEQFSARITDFGTSRRVVDTHITNHNKALTLQFAAPEQSDPDAELRPNIDLWSYAVVVACVWLDGRFPFRDEGLQLGTVSGNEALLKRIKALDLLPEVWKKVPAPWNAVIRRCLVVNPKARVQSVARVRELLAGEPDGWYQLLGLWLKERRGQLTQRLGRVAKAVAAPWHYVRRRPAEKRAPEGTRREEGGGRDYNRSARWYAATITVMLVVGIGWYLLSSSTPPAVQGAQGGVEAASGPDQRIVGDSIVGGGDTRDTLTGASVETARSGATTGTAGGEGTGQRTMEGATPAQPEEENIDNNNTAAEPLRPVVANVAVNRLNVALQKKLQAIRVFNQAAEFDTLQDVDQALAYYKRAANMGHGEAMYKLGWYYQHGYGMGNNDFDEALKWYKRGMDKGNANARKAWHALDRELNSK